MPALTVIIPTYNAQKFISRCLTSVVNQTLFDLDIVVVDDASTDNTIDIVTDFMAQDDRIRLFKHDSNLGTLASRCDGIRQSAGDYITLLDQDDELMSSACEQAYQAMIACPVDILHFGVEVVSESQLAESAIEGMSSFMNPPAPRTLKGAYILEYSFKGMPTGFDWNVHHKLINRNLAQTVERRLKREYLTLPDDAYIMFAIEASAGSYKSLPDSQWYVYHVGEGATLSSMHSLQKYESICNQNKKAYQLAKEYAEHYLLSFKEKSTIVEYALSRMGSILAESSLNEMFDHVDKKDWNEAYDIVHDAWGEIFLNREKYRIARDVFYEQLQTRSENPELLPVLTDDPREKLIHNLSLSNASCSPFQEKMRLAALKNQELLSRRADLLESWKSQKMRIIVSTHREAQVFDSKILQPMQVGSALAHTRFPWALHDDEGETISALNPFYCELTAQYSAWKNLDAEYYGFCHYRRHFCFNDKQKQKENPWGEIEGAAIGEAAAKAYGIDDATIEQCISGFDIITSTVHDVSKFPEGYTSIRNHYERSPFLNIEDLDTMASLVKQQHPEYAPDVDSYLAGSTSIFCNMFIMRKEIFFDYCAWLFPLLEEFYSTWNHENLGIQSQRTPGHLAERLLNVYLLHHERIGTQWKTKQLQCIHFINVDGFYPLEAAEPREADEGPLIPIILAASKNYVPMLATTIQSLIENANPRRTLDIIILNRDIDGGTQQGLLDCFLEYADQARLRFVSVNNLISGYDLSTNNQHISLDTFLRFLIPDLLPFYKKAIYLDCDLVVEEDIAALYDIDIEGKALAATRDVDYLGNLNMDDTIRMDYTKDVLKMDNPYDYFQAGVLLFNLDELRNMHTTEEWLSLASNSSYIYDDQDILNAECEGKVLYLDASWNVTTDTFNRVGNVYSRAPKKVYDDYLKSRQSPQIIHFAGGIKPWTDASSDYAREFWKYACKLPYYEELLGKLAESVLSEEKQSLFDEGYDLYITRQGERSFARKVVDVCAPYGSRRRSVVVNVAAKTIRSKEEK